MGHYVFTLCVPDATGASRMAYHFANAFRRKGHQVTVLHGGEERVKRSILPEMRARGVETVCVPGLAFPISPWLATEIASLLRARRAVGVVGIQQRDRAIALRASARAGIPGFISAQNRHVFWGRWPIRAMKEYYYAHSLREFARLVVCTSPVVAKEVVERFGVPVQRTCVLPNGIETTMQPISAAEKTKLRQEFGIGEGQAMLVNVGRIDIQKAQDVLLDAVHQVDRARPFKMILVGGVTEAAQTKRMREFESKLHRQIERHGLASRVVLAGWRNDIAEILQASDGYVHSARWEGPALPLSVVEAMAAAKPCLSTNCSGRPDGFVDGEHGWIVPTDDAASLARGIVKLLDLTESARMEMGRACRELAKAKFEADRIGDRFVGLIEAAGADARR